MAKYIVQTKLEERGLSRSVWFDAKSFDKKEDAERWMGWERGSDNAHIMGAGGYGYNPDMRCRQMRIVSI